MRFLISDFLIVSIGVAIIATFSFLYYRDITTKVQAGSNKEIGLLTYKRKTAERKYGGQVIWEDIDNDVPVYNNDAIRTADESEALLQLNDGTKIKLDENTMILLASNKDIEFNQGSIHVSRGGAGGDIKKLNIKSGKTRVSIDKSDIKLSQNNAGDIKLSVAKGNANIDTGKGTANVGTAHAAVIAGNSGVVETYEPVIKLTYPAPDSYYLAISSRKKKVDFSWQGITVQYIVYFELSRDYLFDNIVNKKEINGNTFSTELEDGIYYWRIKAVHRRTKKQELSESRRFTVLWDEPIIIISPANKESVTYTNALPIINFKWTKSEIAAGYRFVLSNDPSMNNVIKTLDTPQNSVVLDTLSKGVYYWRIEKITGLDDIPKTAPSGIFEFNIKEGDLTGPPELLSPYDKKQFSKTLLLKQNITFTWKSNPEIREYKFYVAKDDNFKDVVFIGISKVNFFQLAKELPKGSYYWRIIGSLKDNDSTAPSLTRIFSVIDTEEIQLILPGNNAVISPRENEKIASVRFSWRASDIKGKYKFQISEKEDFSSFYKEITAQYQATGLEVRIDPGLYYWKVMLLDDEDSILANSLPRSFTVKNYLEAPAVISPKGGLTVNMSDKNILFLNWKKVAGANLYRVALYRVINGKEHKVADIEETGTSYQITDLRKLDESNFFWTLQAFETAGNKKDIIRKSSVIKSNFKITLGKPVEKVDVNSLKIENL